MTQANTVVLISGFEQASTRFEDAAPGSNDSFQALFEALAWVGALRDRLVSESAEVPPALVGLYYVRNLVLHQGAEVLRTVLVPAALGSFVLGASTLGGGMTHVSNSWPARDQLPAPKSKVGVTEYDAHLAGRPVKTVLAEVGVALRASR